MTDGDTLQAICAGIERRIRISSVDAPERDQDYGPESNRLSLLPAPASAARIRPLSQKIEKPFGSRVANWNKPQIMVVRSPPPSKRSIS
ncbi:MAG: hypothetical protein H7Y20_15475 [Bryobacteraceae bacterium]|nr:hypothetical protein [Bryobacteraceae bacterium]